MQMFKCIVACVACQSEAAFPGWMNSGIAQGRGSHDAAWNTAGETLRNTVYVMSFESSLAPWNTAGETR